MKNRRRMEIYTTFSVSISKRRWWIFAMIFACVRTAPLGWPVVPLV